MMPVRPNFVMCLHNMRQLRPLIGDDLPLSIGPDTVLGATGTARLRRPVFVSSGIVMAFPRFLFRFDEHIIFI